jgi:uncharacterized membrane protein
MRPEEQADMAFCAKCGSTINDGVSFCPACGNAVGAAAAPPPPPPYTNPPYTPYQGPEASTPYQGQPGVPPPGQGYPGQPYPGQQYPGQPYAQPSGLQENVAGLLCYVLGWLTGIIFLLIDKRPFVRFHAAQSIVVFGTLSVLRLVLAFGFFGGHYGFFSFWALISGLLSLVTVVAWIVLMVVAFQGKLFEVPVAGGIAKNMTGSTI